MSASGTKDGGDRGASLPTIPPALDWGRLPLQPFLSPDADPALLRVSVAVGFRRARLQYVYSLLRGKDLDTGASSESRRPREAVRHPAAGPGRAASTSRTARVLVAVALRALHLAGVDLISPQIAFYRSQFSSLTGRKAFLGSACFTLFDAMARWSALSISDGSRYTGSTRGCAQAARLRAAIFREVPVG